MKHCCKPVWRGWPLLVALAGCTVGPNFTPPKTVVKASFWPGKAAPAPSVASVVEPSPIDPTWWKLFHDRELTSLESRLATENLDLATAIQRIGESRAQLGVTRADLLPTLQADGSYTRELPSKEGVLSLFSGGAAGGSSFGSNGSVANGESGTQNGIPNSFSVPAFNLWQYGFDASWEIDIWGHARREIEAARATLQASSEMARDTLVSAEAELARDYIQLRGTERQIAIVQADIHAFNATLDLTRQRAAAGLGTDLDVADSSAQLASAAASLPTLRSQRLQLANAICLMLGKEPGALDQELIATGSVPPVPPVVPVGLPSELIRRRPDIRSAEAQLHAATASVGVAVADFFPQVSLTGSFGFQALDFSKVFDLAAKQYGVGPTITLPIFQGGRLRATLALRRVQQRVAAIAYRQAVLSALGDVSTALASYGQEQTRRTQLQVAVDQNQRAVALSLQRYRQGLSSFIDVLDAQRQELQTEQDLATSTQSVSTDLVALYKALGGGWQNAAPAQLAAR